MLKTKASFCPSLAISYSPQCARVTLLFVNIVVCFFILDRWLCWHVLLELTASSYILKLWPGDSEAYHHSMHNNLPVTCTYVKCWFLNCSNCLQERALIKHISIGLCVPLPCLTGRCIMQCGVPIYLWNIHFYIWANKRLHIKRCLSLHFLNKTLENLIKTLSHVQSIVLGFLLMLLFFLT